MSKIELFKIPDINFDSAQSFRDFLVKHYDSSSTSHELTIVVGLTKYEKTDLLIEALNNFNFELIQSFGAVYHFKYKTSNNHEDEALECYLTHDIDTNVILFYTNHRKTKDDEIPRIQSFLNSDPHSYYLFFKPMLMKLMANELMDRYENLEIHEFSARREYGSRYDAMIRPDYSRSISYWGDDGKQVLNELGYQYGVLPHRFLIYIPQQIKFKVNEKGLFTLFNGDLTIMFSVLEQAVNEAKKTIEAFEGSSFKVFSISTAKKKFEIPSSKPIYIHLNNPIEYHEVKYLKNAIQKEKYAILDFTAYEGSFFLSADVVSNSGYQFRIKADETCVNMYPDEIPLFSEFMKFYEFVLNSIDPRAELFVGDIIECT